MGEGEGIDRTGAEGADMCVGEDDGRAGLKGVGISMWPAVRESSAARGSGSSNSKSGTEKEE